MRIVNLIENTEGREGCSYEHGLSFYIETANHKILMDTGASDAFLGNAEKIGVDLAEVDIMVLSHGHYDHSGGMCAFAGINHHAKLYMQKNASLPHYHLKRDEEKYIGIAPEIIQLPNLKVLEGNYKIDDTLSLFTHVTGRKYFAKGNLVLVRKTENGFIPDPFDHEQYLVIKEEGKSVLFSGCAHNGVINVLEEYHRLYSGEPDVMITGFHMMQKSYTEEDLEQIREVAHELTKTKTIFYSGHCTGKEAFDTMKEIMGDQLIELHSGLEILL